MKNFFKNLLSLDKASPPFLHLISLLLIITISKTLFDTVLILCLSAVLSIGMYFFETLLKRISIESFKFQLMLMISGAVAILLSVILQKQSSYMSVCASTVMLWYVYSKTSREGSHKENLATLGKAFIVPSALLIPFSLVRELLSDGKMFQFFTKEGITVLKGNTIAYASSISFVFLAAAIVMLISNSFFKNKINAYLGDIDTKGITKTALIVLVLSTLISIITVPLIGLTNGSYVLSCIVLLVPYILSAGSVFILKYMTEDKNKLPAFFSIILIVSLWLSQSQNIGTVFKTLLLFAIPLFIILIFGEFYQSRFAEDKANKLMILFAYASIITSIL